MGTTIRGCFDCKKAPPPTGTAHTLITKFGWRAVKRRAKDGGQIVDWRCKECWRKFKDAAKTGGREGDA